MFNTALAPLLIFLLLLFVLVLFLLARGAGRSRQRRRNRCSKPITATVTDIHIEASSLSNGWVVTARWSPPSSSQPLVFVSSRLSYRPRYRVGDPIVIYLNPDQPSDYRMPLND